MKVIIFGATGMIGQGVLLEAIRDPLVTAILSIGRKPCGHTSPKLHEILRGDLLDLSDLAETLSGYDACFYCLGVSSAGMDEASYRRLSYDMPLAAGRLLAAQNPSMVFTFVTGKGCDSSEKGPIMWARVKGATENALMQLPFRAFYSFRPSAIQPLDGIRSSTRLYQIAYDLLGWLFPLINRLAPGTFASTRDIGRAMLYLVKHPHPSPLIEAQDIITLAKADAQQVTNSLLPPSAIIAKRRHTFFWRMIHECSPRRRRLFAVSSR